MAEFKKFSPMRYTAATEEAAVQGALNIVGATRDHIEYEILEKTAKGVTVRIRPAAHAAPKSAAPAIQAPIQTSSAPVTESEPLPYNSEPPVESTIFAAVAEDEADFDDAYDENRDADAALALTHEFSQPESGTLIDAELLAIAREQAEEMLEKMGLLASVLPGPHEGNLIPLTVDGPDVGILIGKHGATLQSFQYLLNLTVNNVDNLGGDPDGGVRIVVDAGNYKARRQSSLEATARQAAARARRDARVIRLDPMPAHERRLIHMYLQSEAEISSTSEGRDPMRRVVITPANARPEAPRTGGSGNYRGSGNGNRQGTGGYRGGGGRSSNGGARPSGFRGR